VAFGRKVPNGWLPVFSVDTVAEARRLITLACPMDDSGNYYARELAEEQTLDNLQKFGDKLALAYAHMKRMNP